MFKYFDYLDDLKDFSEDQKVLALKIIEMYYFPRKYNTQTL